MDMTWKAKDVARYLQASESWVRHAASAGKLPCVKSGGLLRFEPRAIRCMVEGALAPVNTTVRS